MKILFFISVRKLGNGGHYHSLNHISKIIGGRNNVKIVTLGYNRSFFIESNPSFFKHVFFNGINLIQAKRKLNCCINEFEPDVYHCFDLLSFSVVSTLASSNKKIVVNLCGGPNPKQFLFVEDIILFSKENLSWFKSNKKFRNSNIYLIPNRVTPIQIDYENVPIKKDENKFNFLRISRIGGFHKKSILDSFHLMEFLHKKGLKHTMLTLIGFVEDIDFYNQLKTHPLTREGYVRIITEPEFTKEASKMLYLADAVLGTGRGIMEGASLKKPVLTFNANNNMPVLITKETFSHAFETNFSLRNVFDDLENNVSNIENMVTDKDYYEELSQFSYDVFNKFFNVRNVSESYLEVYQKAKIGKRKKIYELPLILKIYINLFRSYYKNKFLPRFKNKLHN